MPKNHLKTHKTSLLTPLSPLNTPTSFNLSLLRFFSPPRTKYFPPFPSQIFSHPYPTYFPPIVPLFSLCFSSPAQTKYFPSTNCLVTDELTNQVLGLGFNNSNCCKNLIECYERLCLCMEKIGLSLLDWMGARHCDVVSCASALLAN